MLVLVPLLRTDIMNAAMQVLSSTMSGLVFQEICTDIQQALSKIWASVADFLTKNFKGGTSPRIYPWGQSKIQNPKSKIQNLKSKI